MTPLSFTIPIAPHGKERPRARVVIQKGKKPRADVYTPAKTRNWCKEFKMLAKRHRPSELISGPVSMTIVAYFERPQYMSKRSKRTGEMLGGYSEGPELMTARPDADNVAKSVMDALDDWWTDDAIVQTLTVKKLYHAMGESPRVCVTFWPDEIAKEAA